MPLRSPFGLWAKPHEAQKPDFGQQNPRISESGTSHSWLPHKLQDVFFLLDGALVPKKKKANRSSFLPSFPSLENKQSKQKTRRLVHEQLWDGCFPLPTCSNCETLLAVQTEWNDSSKTLPLFSQWVCWWQGTGNVAGHSVLPGRVSSPSRWGASWSSGASLPISGQSPCLSELAVGSLLSLSLSCSSFSSPLVTLFLSLSLSLSCCSHRVASVLAVENRYPFYFIFITLNKLLLN